jgi:CRP/FNR family transcriptional regulator, cyclic AMP receptor protein
MNIFHNAPDVTEVPAGTEIFKQGDAGHTLFAIVEGTVEVVRDGRVLEELGAGAFFGEMSLIDQSPRSATVRAKTACRVVAVDEKRFLFMVQQTPFFALEVMRTLVARLRHRLQDVP